MGGDALRAAGGEVIFDFKQYSIMGIVEIIKALPMFFALRDSFRKVMEERQPDCFVTVDYPEFNMRAAKVAKELHIPVLSYIPPSAWVWRKGRAKMVAGLATKVACIYPFSYAVYKAAGANVDFVGNPLVDIVHTSLPVEEAKVKAGKVEGRPLILLLPGSRVKEITNVLPVMLAALPLIKAKLPNADFVLQKAATIDLPLMQSILQAAAFPVKVVEGNNYDIMSVCDAAIATSGTVTLEAALCGLPSVICYKANSLTVAIAKMMVQVKYIGLPNLIAGKEILPELIQEKMTADNIAQGVLNFLTPDKHELIKQELQAVAKKLGEPGATKRIAELILRVAGENK